MALSFCVVFNGGWQHLRFGKLRQFGGPRLQKNALTHELKFMLWLVCAWLANIQRHREHMVRLLEPTNRPDRALVGIKNNRGVATFGRALVNT